MKVVQPVVWMAYMGCEGTRTPLHIDKVGSIAFNLHAFGPGIKKWWLIRHTESSKLEEAIAQKVQFLLI